MIFKGYLIREKGLSRNIRYYIKTGNFTPDAIFTDIHKLNPEDFYDDKNNIIFANMKAYFPEARNLMR